LKDKPLFKDIVEDFLQFVQGAELIIHNAAFDMGFLNAELQHISWKKSLDAYCPVIDTLMLARKKHPGQRNSLDALCKRYDIDNSNRQLHGALLDAEILALVYLAMTGGQSSLFAESQSNEESVQKNRNTVESAQLCNPVVIYPDAEEQLAHEEFLKLVATKSPNNYWN
jgi:DNA polymerase-3 subunit epsilon